jgi:adenosylmethionine-8-amino-7-oxononanoate aminotransferase
MEAALKLAMEYFVWQGQPERTNFIARHESYHGTTLGSLSVSGRRSFSALSELTTNRHSFDSIPKPEAPR